MRRRQESSICFRTLGSNSTANEARNENQWAKRPRRNTRSDNNLDSKIAMTPPSSTKRASRAFAGGRRGIFFAKLVSTTPRNERLGTATEIAEN